MGISRSTSTSLGVAAKFDPENIELTIEKLKEIAPHASPNKIMTQYYDEILNLNNRLYSSLAYFNPEPIEESKVVELEF
jgi:predicted protein tyrosine phosphatase